MGQAEARALDDWIKSGRQLIFASNSNWTIQSSPASPVKSFLAQHDITPAAREGSAVEFATFKGIHDPTKADN